MYIFGFLDHNNLSTVTFFQTLKFQILSVFINILYLPSYNVPMHPLLYCLTTFLHINRCQWRTLQILCNIMYVVGVEWLLCKRMTYYLVHLFIITVIVGLFTKIPYSMTICLYTNQWIQKFRYIESTLITVCLWEPRVRRLGFFKLIFSVMKSGATSFVRNLITSPAIHIIQVKFFFFIQKDGILVNINI